MTNNIKNRAEVVARKLLAPELNNEEFDELVQQNKLFVKLVDELEDEDSFLRRQAIINSLNIEKEIATITSTRTKRLSKLLKLSIASSIIVPIAFLLVYLNIDKQKVVSNFTYNITEDIKIAQNGEVTLVLGGGESLNLIIAEKEEGRVIESGISIKSNEISYTDLKNSIAQIGKIHKLLVPKGKQAQVTLSDGTKVWLNADSEISYPVTFSKTVREVRLKGEAFFEVTHNASSPFVVVVDDSRKVKVLGTAFNVKAYDSNFMQTTLLTGKVEVTAEEHNVQLTPSQQLTAKRGEKPLVTTIDPNDFIAWRDGWLVFNGEKLSEVLDVLSRCYSLEFELQDDKILDRIVSAKIKHFDDYNVVFDIIEKSLQIEFVSENNKIFVKNKNLSILNLL